MTRYNQTEYVAKFRPVAAGYGRHYEGFADPALILGACHGLFARDYASLTEIPCEQSLAALLRRADKQNIEPWREYVSDRNAPVDRRSLKRTADNVLSAVTAGGPRAVDVSRVRRGEVSGKHLALALRCLAKWKDQVPGWQYALEIAKDALLAEGRDPRGALYGMIESNGKQVVR